MREADIYRTTFSFMDRSVAFSAHDASVIPRLAALIDLPSRAHRPADYSVALREEAGGFAVHTEQRSKYYNALSGAVVALAQVIPFLLLPLNTSYILHSGAIFAYGKAHLFLGPGHIGKSTLALEAWLMGYEILGDDYLLLAPSTATVQAVPKPVKLRQNDGALPDRLKHILPPDGYCIGYAENEWNLILKRGLPRMTPLHRNIPIGSIHLLERSDYNTTSSRLADKRTLFRTPFEQIVTEPRNGLDVLRCFLPIFGEGRVFSLCVGTNATASAVTSILAHASEN
jgi:hypothetical protein